MCLTRRRDVEQNIRQCVGFGGALGVLVGTKTLNELEAMAPVRDELPKSLFVGQSSMQLQGALEVMTGNTQDVGQSRQMLAACLLPARLGASRLVLLLNPPKVKHHASTGL